MGSVSLNVAGGADASARRARLVKINVLERHQHQGQQALSAFAYEALCELANETGTLARSRAAATPSTR